MNAWIKTQLHAIQRLDYHDFDLINAGQWPTLIKLLSSFLLTLSIIFTSHLLLINTAKKEQIKTKEEQQRLLTNYQQQSSKAVNLTAYQEEIQAIEQALSDLLSALPSENEVPRLLDDIQQQANLNQLELLALKLQPPEIKALYIQLPFEIKVKGDFYQLTRFISGISHFNQLVTLHNFNLLPNAEKTKGLTLTIDAKTYRYNYQSSLVIEDKQ